MGRSSSSGLLSVLAFGVAAFLVAGLSILDMFLPRPHDGVVLDLDRGELTVRSVVAGSGAEAAGIVAGDRIAGLGRTMVRTPSEAAEALQRHQVGERVAYLIQRDERLFEAEVQLGPRRLGSGIYLYSCFSGFLFFFIGLFVLVHRPDAPQGAPTRVFFVLCTLFMLFLVCRLRPASYSWVDGVVLTTGTLSLLALPAAFLHFFLVFPRRFRLTLVGDSGEWEGSSNRLLRGVERLVNDSPRFFPVLYLLPPLLYAVTLATGTLFGVRMRLVSGAPLASWVLMGDYLVLGLLALLGSLLQAQEGRERRQIATVFVGTVLGVTPFLLLGVALPSVFRTDRYLFLGVVPLALVPLTFAYAIVRFQFFNIRVIIRRSLMYTVTTAVVGGTYAAGIAAFNALFRDSSLGRSPFFPLLVALAILALFDPLRRRLQEPVDRFFFREVYDARRAVEEFSAEIAHEFSQDKLEHLLTTKLAEVLHLEWTALYWRETGRLVTGSQRRGLPREIPAHVLLLSELARQEKPVRLGVLEPIKALDPDTRAIVDALDGAGARLVAALRTREQLHGVLVLGPKRSEQEFNSDDLQLVRTVANQGALALENARLYRERTRQVELEKELEIARRVQFSLIPAELPAVAGWRLAAHCAPARQVGGDFYDTLPARNGDGITLVVGDVSGKSVAGAMLMVAAREVLHTAALGGARPEEILDMANRRLYTPQPRLFVALAFLELDGGGAGRYALAGQPAPLVRRSSGRVEELPPPHHRLPLGALREGSWDLVPFAVQPGDLLLLYSDGLTEAQNHAGEFFGEERLHRVLARTDGEPQAVVSGVLEALAAFTAGADPYDDITVVAATWAEGR
jgi:serine phosphatase RsbU (regulator of sigma subunit)